MQFSDFNISPALLKALDEMGLHTPTSIQEKSFNIILSGKDVCGIAQTGTGKTLAYLLPCLRMIEYAKHRFPQMLILVPTRELVVQVVQMAETLCKHRNLQILGVYGGVNMRPQADALLQGVDIVVATPGRLYDHIMHGSLNPKFIKKLVIDEMDEMLQLGFRHQLIQIFEMLPVKRQNLLFSATIAGDIDEILDEYFNHPTIIEAAPAGTPLKNIHQLAYSANNFLTKLNLLQHILHQHPEERMLIFTQSKKFADLLFNRLHPNWEEKIGLIHSNKAQNQRFEVVKSFKNDDINIIVATDIIARGIDIEGVDKVINFDLPDVPEHYIHRIGRTGRAQRQGEAISFIQENEDKQWQKIQSFMQMQVTIQPLPENVDTTDILIPEEQVPDIPIEIINLKPLISEGGGAFHEKKEKNRKIPGKKVSHQEKMMQKYGKPKTRGAKTKKKR